jgi:hypothetical protein
MINILNCLWVRFQSEVVSSLQRKRKWFTNPKEALKVGDIVIVSRPNTKPGDWLLGKIEQLFPDPQNVTRKVMVYVNGKSSIHAVSALVPLSLFNDEDKNDELILNKTLQSIDSTDDVNNNQCQTSTAVDHNTPAQQSVTDDQEISAPPTIVRPTLRRSPRFTKALLTFLFVLISSTSTLATTFEKTSIQHYNPGDLILEKIGFVYFFQGLFQLEMRTAVNQTSDLLAIDKLESDFKSFCHTFDESILRSDCNKNFNLLSKYSIEVKTDIMSIAGESQRDKRSIKTALAKGYSKVVGWTSKHKGKIALGGFAWQEFEIQSLRNNIAEQQEYATHFLELHKLQQADVNNKFQIIREMHRMESLKQTIDSYHDNTMDILTIILSRYNNIKNSNHSQQLETSAKLAHGENILLTDPQQIIKIDTQGMVMFELTARLASNPADKFILSSAPTADNQQCSFGNKQIIFLAMRDDQFITQLQNQDVKFVRGAVEEKEEDFTIKKAISEKYCKLTPTTTNDFMLPLNETTILLWANKTSTTLNCNNSNENLERGLYLINLGDNCEVSQNELEEGIIREFISDTQQFENFEVNATFLKIMELPTDPKIKEKEDEIATIIAENNRQTTAFILFGSIKIVIIIVFVAWLIKKYCCRRMQGWLPSYNSPVITINNEQIAPSAPIDIEMAYI